MKHHLVCLSLTDRCNHACAHCCKREFDHPDIVVPQTWLDRILGLEKRALLITGGEPGMAKDELFYLLERETAAITVNTNLTLWTAEEMDRLAARAEIVISVPSLVEAEYAAITGADTFPALMGNLARAPKTSPVVVVVTADRLPTLLQTVDTLADMGFSLLRLPPAYGTPRGPEKDALLDGIAAIVAARPHLNIRLGARDGSNDIAYSHMCNAGMGRLAVRSDGSIVPCPCLDAPILGHIMDTDLDAVRLRGLEFYLSYPAEGQLLCKGYNNPASEGITNA